MKYIASEHLTNFKRQLLSAVSVLMRLIVTRQQKPSISYSEVCSRNQVANCVFRRYSYLAVYTSFFTVGVLSETLAMLA